MHSHAHAHTHTHVHTMKPQGVQSSNGQEMHVPYELQQAGQITKPQQRHDSDDGHSVAMLQLKMPRPVCEHGIITVKGRRPENWIAGRSQSRSYDADGTRDPLGG